MSILLLVLLFAESGEGRTRYYGHWSNMFSKWIQEEALQLNKMIWGFALSKMKPKTFQELFSHFTQKPLQRGGTPTPRSAVYARRQRTTSFPRIQPNLPDRGSVFDYVVDLKQPGWSTWMDTVEPQNIPNGAQVEWWEWWFLLGKKGWSWPIKKFLIFDIFCILLIDLTWFVQVLDWFTKQLEWNLVEVFHSIDLFDPVRFSLQPGAEHHRADSGQRACAKSSWAFFGKGGYVSTTVGFTH